MPPLEHTYRCLYCTNVLLSTYLAVHVTVYGEVLVSLNLKLFAKAHEFESRSDYISDITMAATNPAIWG